MTEPFAPAAPGKVRIVLTGTLVAGALDITAAFVTAALGGAGPARVLASIASGLLGAGACDVGLPAAPLGMLLHFAIMLVICWVFVTAASRLPALIRQPLWSGPLYGVIVYLVMQYLVLPVSAFPYPVASSPGRILQGIVIHVLCVGLPIALITRRGLGESRAA